jgi:hypothetical protein
MVIVMMAMKRNRLMRLVKSLTRRARREKKGTRRRGRRRRNRGKSLSLLLPRLLKVNSRHSMNQMTMTTYQG